MQDRSFKVQTRNRPNRELPPREREAIGAGAGTGTGYLVPVLALIVLAYLSSAEQSFRNQVLVSGVLIAALFAFRMAGRTLPMRIGFLILSTFVILRYLFWRTFYTVEFTDWTSFICALILFLAELYGITVALIGNFVNIAPLDREPVPLPEGVPLPSVDVFIPTYNEAISLVEPTLMGAVQMRYPGGVKQVYLLDDGGTDQKCETGSKEDRDAALVRRHALRELCEKVGATYLTRKRNIAAKAGNINEACVKTSGDLILILDADHIPTEDFLEKTVGYFHQDPKLFLVQTPHFMVNPDPIEKNLNTFGEMPSENDMFYRVIQKGLDFWNSSFFCGSGALLRRKYLQLNGGISTESVTEDAETALVLHARGYNSVYVSRPLLSGLSAETLSGFIGQRQRWAQGMIQVFLLKCPLFLRGLTFPQRLCYFNSCFFWFFPFTRLVYILAPAAFLVFGLKIYAATVETFFANAVPYLIVMFAGSNYLYGRARWSFISELYELLQSMHTIPAIIATFMNPRSPQFKVTPKQETLEENFVSPVAIPFYLLSLVNFFCLGLGFYYLYQGVGELYPLLITLFWSVFNTVILLAVLGALFERRQRRSTPRVHVSIPAVLSVEGNDLPGRIEDISLGGCRLAFPWGTEELLEETSSGILKVTIGDDDEPTSFDVSFRNFRDERGPDFKLGVEFNDAEVSQRMAKVRFVTGSSDRWMDIQYSRESHRGVVAAFFGLLRIGVNGFVPHFFQVWGYLFAVTPRQKSTEGTAHG